MSLFLGKIHYWLFNKIQWFEGLEREVIALAEKSSLDVETLKKEITAKYGEMTPNKPLEEMIDTSNIHGWLQGINLRQLQATDFQRFLRHFDNRRNYTRNIPSTFQINENSRRKRS